MRRSRGLDEVPARRSRRLANLAPMSVTDIFHVGAGKINVYDIRYDNQQFLNVPNSYMDANKAEDARVKAEQDHFEKVELLDELSKNKINADKKWQDLVAKRLEIQQGDGMYSMMDIEDRTELYVSLIPNLMELAEESDRTTTAYVSMLDTVESAREMLNAALADEDVATENITKYVEFLNIIIDRVLEHYAPGDVVNSAMYRSRDLKIDASITVSFIDAKGSSQKRLQSPTLDRIREVFKSLQKDGTIPNDEMETLPDIYENRTIRSSGYTLSELLRKLYEQILGGSGNRKFPVYYYGHPFFDIDSTHANRPLNEEDMIGTVNDVYSGPLIICSIEVDLVPHVARAEVSNFERDDTLFVSADPRSLIMMGNPLIITLEGSMIGMNGTYKLGCVIDTLATFYGLVGEELSLQFNKTPEDSIKGITVGEVSQWCKDRNIFHMVLDVDGSVILKETPNERKMRGGKACVYVIYNQHMYFIYNDRMRKSFMLKDVRIPKDYVKDTVPFSILKRRRDDYKNDNISLKGKVVHTIEDVEHGKLNVFAGDGFSFIAEMVVSYKRVPQVNSLYTKRDGSLSMYLEGTGTDKTVIRFVKHDEESAIVADRGESTSPHSYALRILEKHGLSRMLSFFSPRTRKIIDNVKKILGKNSGRWKEGQPDTNVDIRRAYTSMAMYTFHLGVLVMNASSITVHCNRVSGTGLYYVKDASWCFLIPYEGWYLDEIVQYAQSHGIRVTVSMYHACNLMTSPKIASIFKVWKNSDDKYFKEAANGVIGMFSIVNAESFNTIAYVNADEALFRRSNYLGSLVTVKHDNTPVFFVQEKTKEHFYGTFELIQLQIMSKTRIAMYSLRKQIENTGKTVISYHVDAVTVKEKVTGMKSLIVEMQTKKLKFDLHTDDCDLSLIPPFEVLDRPTFEDIQYTCHELTSRSSEFTEADLVPTMYVGHGGSGKSYKMLRIMEERMNRGLKVAFISPTNTSASFVAHSEKGDVSGKTIHSFFGMTPYDNLPSPNLKVVDALFVDEASMVSTKMVNVIMWYATVTKCDLYIFGDRNQLPAIGCEPRALFSRSLDQFLVNRVNLTSQYRNDQPSDVDDLYENWGGALVSRGKPVGIFEYGLHVTFTHFERMFINRVLMKRIQKDNADVDIFDPFQFDFGPEVDADGGNSAVKNRQEMFLVKGSKLVCMKTNLKANLYNRQSYTYVRSITRTSRRVLVRNDKTGFVKMVNEKQFCEYFHYGGCVTLHNLQSKGVNGQFAVWQLRRVLDSNIAREFTITALTRSSNLHNVFISMDDPSELYDDDGILKSHS